MIHFDPFDPTESESTNTSTPDSEHLELYREKEGPEPEGSSKPELREPTKLPIPVPISPPTIPNDDLQEGGTGDDRSGVEHRTKKPTSPEPDPGASTTSIPNDDLLTTEKDSPSSVMRVPSRANHDLIHHIQQEGLYTNSRRPYIDHYRYILHLITEKRLTDHRFKDEGRPVCIGHKYLHRFLSKTKTSSFLKNLIRWGILESDGQWWNGPDPKALGYRLTERYRNDEVVQVSYADLLLQEKAASREAILDEFDTAIDTEGYKESRLWLQALVIDKTSAESHIESHWKLGKSDYNFRREAVRRIDEKMFWFWTGRKSKRAYHNLTNLPRDLRQFLSIDGKPLCQVDIACSQVVFLHLILKEAGAIPEHEIQDMEALLISNTFYEAIAPPGVPRDRAKDRFYKEVLFAKRARTTKLTRIFDERFPSYSREIARMRAQESGGVPTRAAILQTAEAGVVFPAVHRFSEMTDGKVPIITIHDSLVTVPDSLELAQAALEAEFKERYQFIPVTTFK